MKTLSLSAIALVATLLAMPAIADPISVEKAWARASIGTTGASAAYLTIHNTSQEPDRLVSTTTPVAERAMLHGHDMSGGTARMRAVEAIEIGAGESVELKPGGLHVMLMGLKTPIVEGAHFPLTLTFEHAGTVEVHVHVQEIGDTGYKMQHKHGG
jgi:periplasmic copper chaperone A